MSEETYPCSDCGKLRTKAEGGTVFTVCDNCWDKHYPKEAMTKTKDEMIEEMLEAEKRTMANDRELAGFSEGCRKMYDARQKELDTLRQVSQQEINRLRIVINRICGAVMDNDMAEIRKLVDAELGDDDAAAKKILEG